MSRETNTTTSPYFVHAHVHQGQLIGILSDKLGFKFCIYESGLVEEADVFYPDMETALNAAIEQIDKDTQWKAGFQAYESGQPFPKTADSIFISDWRDAWQANNGSLNTSLRAA